MEQRLRKQRDRKQDFKDQMALREVLLQAAKEEEEAFKKAMLAKFAEDDRIELMNAQKQRMKQLEHKRAVEKLIEERRNQFLADKVRKALGSLVIFIKQQPAHVFISKCACVHAYIFYVCVFYMCMSMHVCKHACLYTMCVCVSYMYMSMHAGMHTYLLCLYHVHVFEHACVQTYMPTYCVCVCPTCV